MRAGRVGSSAQRFEQQGEGGEERTGGLASEQDDAVSLGKRVGIVTDRASPPPSHARPVRGGPGLLEALSLVAALAEAKHLCTQRLLGVTEGKVATVCGRGRATVAGGAVTNSAEEAKLQKTRLIYHGGGTFSCFFESHYLYRPQLRITPRGDVGWRIKE